ncbi:MAG: V-type ATP synthase subunit A [Methanobacteriota archaeon]
MNQQGEIYRIAGPVVTIKGIMPRMYDVVFAGSERLMGEVIQIRGDRSIVQVYEDTTGIKPGEPAFNTGEPLSVELGPGLLSSIYDGIQRPLQVLMEKKGNFIERGITANGLDRSKRWPIKVTVAPGAKVAGGQVVATTVENGLPHRILAPPKVSGTVSEVNPGERTVEEPILKLDNGTTIAAMHRWPARKPRPVTERMRPDLPLITGQRVLDTLFPIAKGGTAAIPGGFGTGKTVTQHQFAKWSDADIVVYVGCGERGNEMTEVLTEFPRLTDPKNGKPLINRTVLIANTSNMPVAAREVSVYTGMTIAEYYRDMGFDVSLMADSTSRWAEAMREISSRLEEMPGEEGYPAYLSAKLAEFYERAGRATTLGSGTGSISVIGAVSPAGGDFSEPVTQSTWRIVKCFWALDTKLRERRHFPAINWLTSYSLYTGLLDGWYENNVAPEWSAQRGWAMATLQRESELQEIVQIVGSDALPEDQRLTLEIARMIREMFLQQNAYHDVDTYSPLKRQFNMMRAIKTFSDTASEALQRGVPLQDLVSHPLKVELAKAKFEKDVDAILERVTGALAPEMAKLKGGAI